MAAESRYPANALASSSAVQNILVTPALLLLLLMAFTNFASAKAQLSSRIITQNERTAESPTNVAKSCTAAFECWRSEPVLEDGMPMELINRLNKRLAIGSARQTRGAKCRCRTGQCMFYDIAERGFLPCQEF
ncbi:hypothetical protein DdX_17199 [Ditylenchus destructor]|uniref:Uncharacterized protein n=1 Tax=Ditylenchus destructor TaxID=166010 RepID=A0AAD4MMS4_9BILA|nr:hypothetical protein DdX_17199 [Ditylenchus destructor]